MIKTLFERLDSWRHFPNYQMERRVDIFFSLYLMEIVQAFLQTTGSDVQLQETIIPEFPVKRDLIFEGFSTNMSVKVDYLLFSKDLSEVFFVELKTDNHSRRESQDFYLTKAEEVGFTRILEGLKNIFIATESKKKYLYLFQQLSDAGCLKLPNELLDGIMAKPSQTNEFIKAIELEEINPKITILFVQPSNGSGETCNYIDFDFISKLLRTKTDDTLATVLGEYLLKWQINPNDDIADYLAKF